MWDKSRINAQCKRKSNPVDLHACRDISIRSILMKVLMNIVLTQLSSIYESQHLTTQFVFSSGKGCNVGIYVIKQLQKLRFLIDNWITAMSSSQLQIFTSIDSSSQNNRFATEKGSNQFIYVAITRYTLAY